MVSEGDIHILDLGLGFHYILSHVPAQNLQGSISWGWECTGNFLVKNAYQIELCGKNYCFTASVWISAITT